MKIIITENQNFLLRRIQQFVKIVEDQIEVFESAEDYRYYDPWWCKNNNNNPNIFFDNLVDRSIEEFINKNWDFFHDDSEKGGSDMDISMLNKIVEDNYGDYIRNLFVRKCRSQSKMNRIY